MIDDAQLLRRYVETKSQAAFAELVQRHINLVYSVALRQVSGDTHLAEDVVQHVFSALARKARTLVDRPTLGGWLYRSVHYAASDVVRGERRRRTREEKVEMETLATTGDSSEDAAWEKARPLIDAAIAELDERDRDAVSLRFFENRSFVDVGFRLNLSENAARMRVERALDKLHAALSKRGVTSTSAALGLALANQAMATVPAGLAGSVAGAAAAGAVGTAALWSILATSKVVASLSLGGAVAASGVAIVQYVGKLEAERELNAAHQQTVARQSELRDAAARLAAAERRAADAERDSGELLKAVDELRREKQSSATAQTVTTRGTPTGAGVMDERLIKERAYQQELAKRRAQEAMARAKIDSEAATEPNPELRYEKMIQAARNYARDADFRAGISIYNQAMQMKPPSVPVTDDVKRLQSILNEQNKPVEVSLLSDGLTDVSLMGPYGVRLPSPLQTEKVRLMPGNYEVTGRRKGFQDVVVPVEVRAGVPAPVISVACSTPAAPKSQ
jgi:RNA polymerase sigma factor (sigma-70 family)